jgi:hypothetical protein
MVQKKSSYSSLMAPGRPKKVVKQNLSGYDGTVAVDSDAEDASADVFDEWEESLQNEVFCEKMVSMSSKSLWNDDDEWILYRLRWLTKQRKAKKGTFSQVLKIIPSSAKPVYKGSRCCK